MSMYKMKNVKCGKCGKESEFKAWTLINAAQNPEMKEAVRSGEVFTFTCPECKTKTNVTRSLLYEEPDKHYMLWYAPEVVDEAYAKFEKQKEEIETNPKYEDLRNVEFTRRVVDRRIKFGEKLLILDLGLNDRIIEIMKVLIEEKAGKVYKEFLLNYTQDGKINFAVQKDDGKWATIPFDQKLYDSLKDKAFEKIDQFNNMVVGRAWARKVLDK